MEFQYQWLISENVMKKLGWTLGFIVISTVVILLEKLWWTPRRIRSVLAKQGITGPKPSFPYGNIPEMEKLNPEPPASADWTEHWVYSIFPYFTIWKERYGSLYTYSTGAKQHMYVESGKVIKDMSVYMAPDFGRVGYLSKALDPMLGDGILRANGKSWTFQRHLITSELFMSKIKNMLHIMEGSATAIVEKWDKILTESKEKTTEIVIVDDLKMLSEDIISKACFGSDYTQGKHVFERLNVIQTRLSENSTLLGFLNLSFLFPSKGQKEIWRLKKEVDVLVMKMVSDREIQNQKNNNEGKQNDLLQKIIEGVANEKLLNASGKGTLKPGYDMNQLIIDICKSIYFAGSESTALSVVWALYLLSVYPEWQQRIRDELSEVFGNTTPSFTDMANIQKLKTLQMVVLESMRIYGPAVTNSRELFADIKFGDLMLPKGLCIWMYVPSLHRDTDNWGPDATEFKPERFVNGVSGACKYPQAYMPFGYGSRFCLGQNFTMTEIKIVIALLLHHFFFELSPNHQHCPVSNLLLVPKYDVKLLISKIDHNTGK